jgi:hypothetical protein
MSHPEDKPVPAPPVSPATTAPLEAAAAPLVAPPLAEAAPVAVAIAAPQGVALEAIAPAPPVPSGPYRVPAPPQDPTLVPEVYFGPPPKRPRPLIGPAISVFAVMLWTFVIAGQFTTSWNLGAPLSQEVAVALILVTTFAAWLGSVRLSRLVVPPRQTTNLVWRAIGIGVLAFVFFITCFTAAAFAGAATRENHDFLIPFVLVVLSLGAALAGRKMTAPSPPQRTARERFLVVAMWIAGTLLTLVAGIDLAANG